MGIILFLFLFYYFILFLFPIRRGQSTVKEGLFLSESMRYEDSLQPQGQNGYALVLCNVTLGDCCKKTTQNVIHNILLNHLPFELFTFYHF